MIRKYKVPSFLFGRNKLSSVVLAILTEQLSGASSTGFIALVNTTLTSQNPPTDASMQSSSGFGFHAVT